MALDPRNYQTHSQYRAAYLRDLDKLDAGSVISHGAIRHIVDDRPEDCDPQVWENHVRADYRNAADFYGLPALETIGVLEAWPVKR